MGPKWLLYPTSQFSYDMNTCIVAKWLADQIEAVATFLIHFGAHVDILFIIKVKYLMLIKESYRSPHLCWLLSVECLSMQSNLF